MKTIWHKEQDLQHYSQASIAQRKELQPTISYQHTSIEPDVIDTIYKDFREKIPMWFYPSIEYDYLGHDGTNYELAFGGFFLGVRYRWWSEMPKEWIPLNATVEKAIHMFEQILG